MKRFIYEILVANVVMLAVLLVSSLVWGLIG